MYLFIAATDLEMAPFLESMENGAQVETLVSGFGCIETTLSLTRALTSAPGVKQYNGVVQFGVGGAYLEQNINCLDICIAEHEELADFGIRLEEEILPFSQELQPPHQFSLKNELYRRCSKSLQNRNIDYHAGRFLTVPTATGTTTVSNALRDRYQAICENMEGVAAARVCAAFNVPFFVCGILTAPHPAD